MTSNLVVGDILKPINSAKSGLGERLVSGRTNVYIAGSITGWVSRHVISVKGWSLFKVGFFFLLQNFTELNYFNLWLHLFVATGSFPRGFVFLLECVCKWKRNGMGFQ